MLPLGACSRTGIQWTIKRSLCWFQLLTLAVFTVVPASVTVRRWPRPHYRTSAVVLAKPAECRPLGARYQIAMLPYYEACSRTCIQWTIKRSLYRLRLLTSYPLANHAVFTGVSRTSHCSVMAQTTLSHIRGGS